MANVQWHDSSIEDESNSGRIFQWMANGDYAVSRANLGKDVKANILAG